MEEQVFYRDPVAERLEAFASLATTIADIKDSRIKELAYEMLENTIRTIEVPKPPSATILSVVGE